ncbi:MAG: DUF3341 domain-containing protein [Candidatus Eisenbacteria bacterium]|nr:DUF3341 domain-containing protein [Candidatus Eisenbacteria bacterium]
MSEATRRPASSAASAAARGGNGHAEARKLYGLAVEFDNVDGLLSGCERVRDAGYRRWDAYTPFPVHGLNDAMGIRHTKLPLVVLGAGIAGAGLALLMEWWMSAVNYPLVISGKPLMSLPAFIPVVFEMTILFAAITTFVGMLVFNDLPRWSHPIFGASRFARVTTDRFLICIEAGDPLFDEARTADLLASLGGSPIERIEEEEA